MCPKVRIPKALQCPLPNCGGASLEAGGSLELTGLTNVQFSLGNFAYFSIVD